MLQANFESVDEHLQTVLHIELTSRLRLRRPGTIRTYATIGALVVLYRYAEALHQTLVVHDVASMHGHVSHQLGTELDFTHSERGHSARRQAEVVSDLLRIRSAVRPSLTAFRIGFYFARFDDQDALDATTFEEFLNLYGTNRLLSNHLGIRYPWTSDDYRGEPAPRNYGAMSFWGRGSRTFGQGRRWERRILSWDIGLLNGDHALVAQRVLDDFATLDRNPPSHVMLGAAVQ